MDNAAKYLHFKYDHKNPFEIVQEMMSQGKTPLYAIKEIRTIFPAFSLMEAKEIVVIATSEFQSLYDYQGSLLIELQKLLDEEMDQ